MSIKGIITAPEDAEQAIKDAGFIIVKKEISSETTDFTVIGSNKARDFIDDNWGWWIWTLTQIKE